MPLDQELRVLGSRGDRLDPNMSAGECNRPTTAVPLEILAENVYQGRNRRSWREGKEAAFVNSIGRKEGSTKDASRPGRHTEDAGVAKDDAKRKGCFPETSRAGETRRERVENSGSWNRASGSTAAKAPAGSELTADAKKAINTRKIEE
jgi:hypothetical protein